MGSKRQSDSKLVGSTGEPLLGSSKEEPPARAAGVLRRARRRLIAARAEAVACGDDAWARACQRGVRTLRRLELQVNYRAGRVPR